MNENEAKIKVKNVYGKNTGVNEFLINGKSIQNKEVPVVDDGNVYDIEIFM